MNGRLEKVLASRPAYAPVLTQRVKIVEIDRAVAVQIAGQPALSLEPVATQDTEVKCVDATVGVQVANDRSR